MDRKIEVDDEYDVRMRVVAISADNCVVTKVVGYGGPDTNLFRHAAFAHATLVKAAERPLAVGDMVRLVLPNGVVGEIIAIVGKRAWVEFRNGIGAIRDLDELIRAEPT